MERCDHGSRVIASISRSGERSGILSFVFFFSGIHSFGCSIRFVLRNGNEFWDFFCFFQVTASILQPIPVKLPSNWNMVFEFDVIWPIPTTEDYKKKYKNKYKYKRRQWMVKRRHRRELYATFEMALNRYEQVSAYSLSRPRFSEGKLAFQPKLAGKGVHVENDLRGENFVESTRRFLRGRCPSIDIKVRYLPL